VLKYNVYGTIEANTLRCECSHPACSLFDYGQNLSAYAVFCLRLYCMWFCIYTVFQNFRHPYR